ncbi:malto-oligosyltrehalose synthase [Humisphaera borealis]|uniref:Malto-oligosyltrehalose synthase n=1 Tax=Humisphaera borealis TaxID=2807512 RepID=A0A7M2X0R7_9BACT|nr:malto-oligosyltrehalose synthase [Humisphaera borealis]QOV91338.1 malto-oligosyltrehalose synthase [Humisphaera borealis]
MTSTFPESTYRVQFHADFTFRDATEIVPYLADLGVTHLYASPYLKARPGSTHGYDVIDHCRLNPELGTQRDFEDFLAALERHGMSHILDIVPNHVGIATNENVWWNDVLANGPSSHYGRYFDIAWQEASRPELSGKVLLPLLGKPYGVTLEDGELTLSHDGNGFWINYQDRKLPVSPATLKLLHGEDAAERLRQFNGTPGEPRSFDALDAILDKQFYRLACWTNASDEINYRRFFDVNELAALAMERAEVFEETHGFVFKLIKAGHVAGLRIDHPDGLYNPREYFERLQQLYRKSADGDRAERRPLYVLAEKILAADETLPTEWSIHGTSGYDFLNHVNGLFIDSRNEQAITQIYSEWLADGGTTSCGACDSFETLGYGRKKFMLETAFASELRSLARRLDRLAQRNRLWRDFTLAALVRGLKEVIACFGVYRTYIEGPEVSASDRQRIEAAIGAAIGRNPASDVGVFHFIRDVLLQRYPETFSESDRADQLAFAGKFQQLTSPVTAKGIEDTSFYVYNRFVSLNEVGGDPARFGVAPDDLHTYFADRQRDWPYAMSTLSTHDTKRSEDVRARLNVLSEIPDQWRTHATRWRDINAGQKAVVAGRPAPDANDEYLIYQTLLGVAPLGPWSAPAYAAVQERVCGYVLKALREAKVHTTWTNPNAAYEQAVQAFVARLLDRKASPQFWDDFDALRGRVATIGLINSLSQTLLRLAAPGVPDTFQGTESWDFSLVDPDNRRPVSYERLRAQLHRCDAILQADPARRAVLVRELLDDLADGSAKVFLQATILRLRRAHPGLLSAGTYDALPVTGAKAKHVFAFMRRSNRSAVVVVVPRLIASLLDDRTTLPLGDQVWGDTAIELDGPTVSWRNLLTNEQSSPARRIVMGDVCNCFPVYAGLASV